jgi:hypothetical protein
LERVEADAKHALHPKPEDPDGLSSPARFRFNAQMWAASYARSMDGEQLVTLLRLVYGSDAVIVEPGAAHEHGLFIEFQCPRCGLVSLSSRSETCWTCFGCMRQFPFRPELVEARPMVLPCASCGALVTFERQVLESRCRHCDAAARRVADDGAIYREWLHVLGLPKRSLPPEGEGGFEVTNENRMRMVLDGLERIATSYASLITPMHYARIVASTFSHASDEAIDRVVGDVVARLSKSANHAAALSMVTEARRALQSAR